MLENDTFSSFYSRHSAQVALCNWPNAQERETLKDLFIGRIRDVDVQEQLIKAKADLDDTFKLALECESVQAHLLNSKNYSLIISIQTLLRLNKNPLSRFSRLEENGTTIKIKTIDKTHKVTKGISHVTSVVILLVRISKNLVQLKKLRVTSVANVVISQSAAIRQTTSKSGS